MSNKKALVITYHLKNCKRVGGFHRFIDYFIQLGYDVDWVTSPVSSTWIFHNRDRENAFNFFQLAKGIAYKEKGVNIRHFSVPLWIPARIKMLLGLEQGYHYWPKWSKLRRKLQDNYDVIFFEGVGCQYVDYLKHDYPSARIIYRPSDVLETFCKCSDAIEIEKKAIELADCTLCVDENEKKYYTNRIAGSPKIEILRNPLSDDEDIERLKHFHPCGIENKTVVYLGVSFVDLKCIEYAARNNRDAEFIIIGPNKQQNHDNVTYTGSLNKKEYSEYLKKASVGISPIVMNDSDTKDIVYGYTKKIISYMTYLLPVVTTRGSNYLNLPGFYNAETIEEFSDYVSKALDISCAERERFRENYLEAVELFSERKCYKDFKYFIGEDDKKCE